MPILLLLYLLTINRIVFAAPVLSATEIAPGIYVHFGTQQLPDTKNHGAIANIGFIVGGRCVAVIDTGGNPEQGRALKKAIAHTTDKPVCYVINTHAHPDHIYGNAAFRSPNVKFVGHEKLAEAMSARGAFYLDKSLQQLGVQLTADDIVFPEISVKNQLEIDLGGRVLKLTAHQTAHTNNDLSVYDAKTDTLWLSDLLFIGHIPVVDGSLKGWLAELANLEQQHFQRVVPGHGPVATDWPMAMQAEKDYLSMLLRETRTMIKQGKFLENALEEAGYSAQNQWLLFDQFHRKNISTVFPELEWEE